MKKRDQSDTKSSAAPRFAEERQLSIANELRELGRVEVAELAERFQVSEDSIRRDLRLLASRGLVVKTHGGAVAVQPAAMPLEQRASVLPAAKRRIALAAASLVQPHQTLFIDGGTTALALARELRKPGSPRPLTVVTHALDVATVMADDPNVRLVLAGGTWLKEQRVFYGEQSGATLRAFRADIAFLGACALHPRMGITAVDAGEASSKRAMMEGSVRRVVLSDASKLDTVAPHAVASLSELDLVISDAKPDWLAEQVRVELV